jgi:hypothetical protein
MMERCEESLGLSRASCKSALLRLTVERELLSKSPRWRQALVTTCCTYLVGKE